MDPNKRLQLNFGGGGGGGQGQYNNERTYDSSNNRVFPTTPSTFPQPVYGNQGGNTPGTYSQQAPSPYASSSAGYFPPVTESQRPLYAPQYAQYQQPQQQQNLATPQPSYQQQQRQGGGGTGGYNTSNDPTSNLAHQFQNQNLGAPARQSSPFGRQPSPSSRLYSNTQQPQHQTRTQQSHASNQRTPPAFGTPPALDTNARLPQVAAEDPPERNPELYSPNVWKRGQALRHFVQSFFTENIGRARDRNIRAEQLDAFLAQPSVSEAHKRQQKENVKKAEAQYLRFLRTRETPRNFSTVKIIGKGAFGEVKLVQRKTDGKIYALKSLVKTEMFKKDQLAHVRAERDILAEADSPWVVKLHTTFQDNTYLYMLMEFLPGGDLMTMLIKYEIFSIPITRFYMAEIVLAIEAVHKHGYIHRDIKPDNILLDKGGHVKLTDFGLSTGFHKQHENSYYAELLKGNADKKKRDNRQSVSLDQINLTISNRTQVNTWRKSRRVLAYSTVGTPDYIAPEIFSGAGYSFGCDWWSVGAIMFECLVGWPPFCAEDAHDTYRKIVNWKQHLYFPDDLTLPADPSSQGAWPDAERCIRQLLCDHTDRLGHAGGQHGAAEIKAHPFFKGVIWDSLRGIHAPFKPDLKSAVDCTYFPIHEIDQSDHSSAHRAAVDALGEENEAELNLPFIGYTFKRFATNN